MADIKFETVEVPAVTRAIAPNPFSEAISALIGDGTTLAKEARRFKLLNTTTEDKPAKTTQRQLRDAGTKRVNGKQDVTVRQSMKQEGKDVVVTFWVVEKITHADANGAS
jgi:hypothetical protein